MPPQPHPPSGYGLPQERVLPQSAFLLHFRDRHRYPKTARPFCFILGAGASVQSGIPSAGGLIDEWLPDLHNAAGSTLTLEKWATSDALGIKNFAYDNRWEFYPQLYDLRFRERPEDGAIFLQEKMSRARPSYGYAVLAQLLAGEHRIVITTNFDNLASDALFQFGGDPPFVCGHESLAGYIPARAARPVIVKLHRDLFTGAINDPDGVAHLARNWHAPIQDILQRFTPVFIGYGGNDGSLMTFLENLPAGVPDKVYWCQYKRSAPNARVAAFLNQPGRFLVPIDGFDQLMSDLYHGLALPSLLDALEKENQTRLSHLRHSQEKLTATARQDVAAAVSASGPDSPEALAARYQLAVALQDQAHYAEAEKEHAAILAARRRVLGSEHPDTLKSWSKWTWSLLGLGQPSRALPEFEALVAIRTRVLGPEHPYTLHSRSGIACAHADLGKSAEAEAENRAVLALRERILGLEDPETLGTRNNLANALHAQGKFAEAEAENRAVLAVRERVLGPEHPDTLNCRNNLASALGAQGKFAEAETEIRTVLALCERVLGPDHPNTLSCRSNLANTLRAQGKDAEAETEHRKRIVIEERVLGPEHPQVLRSHYNLSVCLESQGDQKIAAGDKNSARSLWHDALTHAETACRLGEKVLGPDHPSQTKYTTSVAGLQKKLDGAAKKKTAKSPSQTGK